MFLLELQFITEIKKQKKVTPSELKEITPVESEDEYKLTSEEQAEYEALHKSIFGDGSGGSQNEPSQQQAPKKSEITPAQQRLEKEAQQIEFCRMIDECAEYGKFQKECATAGDIDKCVLLKMSPKPVPNYCTRDGTGQVAFMGPTSIVTKLDCKIARAKEMGEKFLNKLK